MWPRDAYPGQFVAAVKSITCPETGERLERGKVYTIADISIHDFFPVARNVVYFRLQEIPTNIVRYDLVKPVDESRLDVFRKLLKPVNEHADA